MTCQQVELSFCEKLVLNSVYKYYEMNDSYPRASGVRGAIYMLYYIEWETQTILTFLKRIENKGYLLSERKGNIRYYKPAMPRMDYLHLELYDMATLYCCGNVDILKETIAVM